MHDYEMVGFQWVQAVGIAVTLLSFLIGLPVTVRVLHFEHRLASQVDMAGKALAQTSNPLAVQLLASRRNQKVLRLAATLAFPMPRLLRAGMALALVLQLAVAGLLIALPVLGPTINRLLILAAVWLFAIALNALTVRRAYVISANRLAFRLAGAPWNFKPARKLFVYYRGTWQLIPMAAIRLFRDIKKSGARSMPLARLQCDRGWRRIVSSQERYHSRIKKRPFRKRRDMRKRARKLTKLQRRKRRARKT